MTTITYSFAIRPLAVEEGGGYLIEFPDLPGCISHGETPEEAMANGKDAVAEWIDACKKLGRNVPAPSVARHERNYNGKVLQRFPKTMHARLVARAKQEGVSLNQLILSLVSEGMGRRSTQSDHHGNQL